MWSNRATMVWLLMVSMATPASAADPVMLYSAGSLRSALSEAATAFEAATGVKVKGKFGPSGVLKDEIVGCAKADVFTSANMEHPQALAASKRGGPVVLFARNRLCALTRPRLKVTSASLVEVMLDPAVKLGTSTPRNDPSGDYAWELFHKADKATPGVFAQLETKAIQLVGNDSAPVVPAGRSVYALLISQQKADIFLTYCTNAIEAQHEVAGLQIVQLPPELAVAADYGLTVINGAPASAYQFAMFILSADGQRSLAKHGFAAPLLPQ